MRLARVPCLSWGRCPLWRVAGALLCGLSLGGAWAKPASTPTPQLLWLDEAGVVQAAPATAGATSAPLGSLWKLFVYSYLVAQAEQEPAYRCDAAQRRDDEEYCCEPGESVDRDTALARSCGPYFAPQRLGLRAPAWQAFWRSQAERGSGGGATAWLQDLAVMQPATQVPVTSLLHALQQVPAEARQAARQALLPNNLREPGVLAALGSGPRFKTWSWRNANNERIGGAAGWLADGTPFWFGAGGTSRSALRAQAGWIVQQWQPSQMLLRQPDAAELRAQACVEVAFFKRYPLASVQRVDGQPAKPGPLAPARYQLRFANGQSVALQGSAALQLRLEGGQPRLWARLPLEDYVARVLDREADATRTEAARALAIAARTWLLHNTTEQGGCRAVDDDSRAQRVSPQPPSPAAQAVVAFTADLVLRGAPVRYHLDQAGPGVLAWRQAERQAAQGLGFEAILRQAFPTGALAGVDSVADCQPLAEASQWLKERQQRWRSRLHTEVGYEPPATAVQVCQLQQGVPHSDQRRLRIHVREWLSREGRVTLIHEYLHLAFRHHPRGRDEAFVERLAQSLADS
ncbi:MAG: DUF2300 domain-containing protein [Ideonella sp.]|nr:DUF2300 domain-containing protein [Ideonella sp.]